MDELEHQPPPPPQVVLAPNLGPASVRRALLVLGALFVAMMAASAGGSNLPRTLLPSGLTYFVQIARLFPRAGWAVIDYRAEGWDCATQRFVEIDFRPHFPIHADNKESRFARALFFHRSDRPVLQALDAYLVTRHNQRLEAGAGAHDTPPPQGPIGGVRLVSLRRPIPPAGYPIERFSRPLLARIEGLKTCKGEYRPGDPQCLARLFWTRQSLRAERCAALGVPSPTAAPRPRPSAPGGLP